MRPGSGAPLGSVALRYRHPLVRTSPIGRGLLRSERVRSREELPPPSETGRDWRMRRLEAVLFLAKEPLSSRKLSQYAGLADGTEARTLVRRLNRLYDEAGRAFRAEQIAGGYQLMTRPALADWLRRMDRLPAEVRLSTPAAETLAVVAYRQPVVRAEVEAIRGVASGEILRQLMERDLVRISGRSEELGRPYQYSTTRRFLQVFGLGSLDELPRANILRDPATGPVRDPSGERPADEPSQQDA
jgi:segregation and condensation protein B